MIVEECDERDSSREVLAPTYRVYVYAPAPPEGSHAVVTYDLRECSVVEALRWADQIVEGGEGHSVAVLGEDNGRRGLIWLFGGDPNDSDGEP